MIEIFTLRPHHAFQELERGENNPASTTYTYDPNEEVRNQEVNTLFWKLPNETVMHFSLDGQGDPFCQSCHLHPDRYEMSLRDRYLIRRGWFMCNIEEVNQFDTNVFQEMIARLGHSQITLGDFKKAFSTSQEGRLFTKIIVGDTFSEKELKGYPYLFSLNKRVQSWRKDS